MKYQKKSDVVEAFRFGHDVAPAWFTTLGVEREPTYTHDMVHRPCGQDHLGSMINIDTPMGRATAKFGDYIVKDNNGNISACPAEEFESNYELIQKKVTVRPESGMRSK